MNEVIELSGLSRLLSTMNQVQLKHLRSYMEMFDQENKSAKLFSFLSEESSQESFEDISKHLGYSSKAAPAFRKLVRRFSTKVYDYLLTDHAIRYGNPDTHSREKNEAIKKNLQAFMLLELNNPERGLEIVDSVLDSALRNELFTEAKEAVSLKKKLEKKMGLPHQNATLELKINTLAGEKEKMRVYTNNIMAFNYGACTDIQWKQNAHDIKKLTSNSLSALQSSSVSIKIGHIRKLQLRGNYAEAYVNTIELYHTIRKMVTLESGLVEHVKTLLLENSILNNKLNEFNQLTQFYAYRSGSPSILSHHQYELVFYHALFNADKALSDNILSKLHQAEYLKSNPSLTFRIHYYQCLYSFVYDEPKVFLDLVSVHFKKLGGPDSTIALYLRALELVCFYRKEKFELLEYKIRNFVKSVNRYVQKNPCHQLKSISHLFNLLLRKNFMLTQEKIMEVQHSNSWISKNLSLPTVHNPVIHFISEWVFINCMKSKTAPH